MSGSHNPGKNGTRVICNPKSGGGDDDLREIRRQLQGYDADWVYTRDKEHARQAAEEWDEGLLIVVGGDGTVNDVVNGLGNAGFPRNVVLGIIPTGTGNDLAATLCIPEDSRDAVETLESRNIRTLDAAHASSSGIGEQYFVNVATGGFGAEASSTNSGDLKKNWGKASYLRASLEVASKFEMRDTKLTLDKRTERMKAVNIAVGNCRYAGGGWLAAPAANPEDGLLDIVVIKDVGMKELLGLAPTAISGEDYLEKEGIFHARARDILVETEPEGLEFTVDGEIIGDEPVTFSVVPGSLNVIVGEGYTAETENE